MSIGEYYSKYTHAREIFLLIKCLQTVLCDIGACVYSSSRFCVAKESTFRTDSLPLSVFITFYFAQT